MFKILNIKTVTALVIVLSLFVMSREASAGTGDNLSGWAWSSKVGWISFNCTTLADGCDVLGDIGAGDDAGDLGGGGGGGGGGTGTGGTGDGAYIKGLLKKVAMEGIEGAKYSDPFSYLKNTFSFITDNFNKNKKEAYADDLPGGGALGSSVNYGVRVNTTTGAISGWAWSDNVGWISFNASTGCPDTPCSPTMDMESGYWSGWARATAGGDVATDGWDGWISLSCKNHAIVCLNPYRVQVSPLTGEVSAENRFAWGADVMGWINFWDVTLDVTVPIVSLSASPITVMEGGSTTLTWWSLNTTSCTASSSDALWSGVKPLENYVGEVVIPSGEMALLGTDGLMHYYTNYSLSCVGEDGSTASSEALVEVSVPEGALGDLVLQATPTVATPDNGYKVKLTWSSPSDIDMNACFGNATNITGAPIPGTGWDGPKTSLNASNMYTASTGGETITVPQNPTRFKIQCINGDTGLPETAYTDVTRGALTPSVTISASGISGTPGSYTADLSWTTSNLTSCVASNEDGITAWNGSKSASEGTHSQDNVSVEDDGTTYTIECSGPYGVDEDSVTVIPDECAPGDDGCDIVGPWVGLTYSNFVHDALVGTTKLIWQTQDLASCTASSTEPTSGWTGDVTASPDGVYSMSGIGWTATTDTYTISCIGEEGEDVSDSITLDMTTPTNPAPITPIYEEF
jgi:hypothetical protein